MQLALAAGRLNVDNMLDEMSSEQFTEWQAFYQLFPFGAQADTHRFAVQQANILNAPHFCAKKAREPSEFIPHYRQKQQTIEEQIAILKGLK